MNPTAVPATTPSSRAPDSPYWDYAQTIARAQQASILAEHLASEAAVVAEAHPAARRRTGAYDVYDVYEPTVAEIEARALELERDPFKVARWQLVAEHRLDRLANHLTGVPQREELDARLAALEATIERYAQVATDRLNGDVGQRSIEELRADVSNFKAWGAI